MAFARPTLLEIIDRVETDLEVRLNSGNSVLRRSFIAVIARVIAGASHLLHGHLEYIFRQVFPDTADETNFPRWATLFGVARNEASFAEGDVTFTGTNGTQVPIGTEIQRADGAVFETQTLGTISGGTLTVDVIAQVAGTAGNTDTGTVMTLVSSLSGVNSQVTVVAPGLSGGSDQEDLEAWRARFLAKVQDPPLGGAEQDYVQWALEVTGVTRVWVYENNQGPGTVGVTFVRDNDSPIIPDSNEVQTVQDYIEVRRPLTAEVTVFAPTSSALNFTIELLTADTSAIRAAVEQELKDLIQREAEPGGTILLTHINEAISIATGEIDHETTVPAADVTAAPGALFVFGAITWL